MCLNSCMLRCVLSVWIIWFIVLGVIDSFLVVDFIDRWWVVVLKVCNVLSGGRCEWFI